MSPQTFENFEAHMVEKSKIIWGDLPRISRGKSVPSLKSICVASLLNYGTHAENRQMLQIVKRAILFDRSVTLYRLTEKEIFGDYYFNRTREFKLEITTVAQAQIGETLEMDDCYFATEYYYPANPKEDGILGNLPSIEFP